MNSGKVSLDAQAAIAAVFLGLQQRIAGLDAPVRNLQARLGLNSTNSSKPPSSDPVGLKRKPPAPPSGRNRGGQPGHPKAQRAPVPPEQGRSTTDCKPTACRRCHHPLTGDNPEPLIHQVAELPVFEPLVDQYRLHRLVCPDCGATTCGVVPPGVPTGSFGPRLQGDQNKPKAALRDRHADLERESTKDVPPLVFRPRGRHLAGGGGR